jgi:predicted ATPase/DNA-binding CsgD family transcriptional regulator
MTDSLRNNLHALVTSLVGRRAELSRLARLAGRHRLLTIAGAGGSGKTRLAAELSRRIVETPIDPPGGAEELWWVDLAPSTDPRQIAHTCARAIGVRLDADGRDPVATLLTRIGTRRMIIVLDTCEHLLDPVADLVERVLARCPNVSVLATSREPLGVPGEAVWRVPALDPADAAELFVERAGLAVHEVALSPADPLVHAICDRLDGLPLAIELASAWTRVLTVEQILAGLDERFRLLTGGLRRGTPRHRTLEASMAWSHDLLEPEEQCVLRRLAVFVGDFGLPAAEEVCAHPPDGHGDLIAVLARLVDKSLLVARPAGGGTRYRLLDTVREYAADKLAGAGELADTRDRHLEWCLRAAHTVDERLRQDQDDAMRLFDEIEENAAAALDWALQPAGERAALGRRLAHLLVMPWFLRSQSHRGRPFLNRAIATTGAHDDDTRRQLASDAALLGIVAGRRIHVRDTDTTGADLPARARLALVEAYETFFADQERCERLGVAASALGREAGDPFVEDFALIMASYSLTARERHDDARRVAAPALDHARERGDRFCVAFALGLEQYAAMQTGRLTDAVRIGRDMVDLITPLGDYFGLGTLTVNLALAMCLTGDTAGARRVMAPVVDFAESAADIDVVGLPVPMGHAGLREGDWDAAAQWFGRGLARLADGAPDWTAARCLPGAVEALRRLHRTAEAAELAARGQELGFSAPEYVANLTEQRAYLLPDGDPLADTLHRRVLDIRVRSGQRTFIPDSLDALARQGARERPRDAAYLLAAGGAARDRMSYPRARGALPDHDALVDRLRSTLGARAFDAAWQEGARASLDDAVEVAQRGRRRPARPSTGWASLTPSELGVVRLIAQGATNAEVARRLVISRATVKTHLYHVFAKLDITNRTELAAIVHAHLPAAQAGDPPDGGPPG